LGGGVRIKYQNFELDLSTDGLIQKVIDYQNNSHDREAKQQILDRHIKNLQIKQPDDLIKVLKISQKNESQHNQNSQNNVNESQDDTTSTP
jgi:phosphomevalonate kinase